MEAGPATCSGCGRCDCCPCDNGECWCDEPITYPDLGVGALQWTACEQTLIEDPDGNQIVAGGEIGTVYDVDNELYVLNDATTGNPGPTWRADCPAFLFAPAEDKGGSNELLAFANPGADQVAVALIWDAPAGPYTLLIPQDLDPGSLWWVWDDGVNFNVANGDNSTGYSTASPGEGVHVLVLACNETEAASFIRLDGVDIEPPGALWGGSASAVLVMSNVEIGTENVALPVLWCAWVDLASEGGGLPE